MFTKKRSDINELMPYFSIEENKIIMKDGRVVIGCRVDGIVEERWNQKQYEEFCMIYESALSKLSTGTCVTKIDDYNPTEIDVSNGKTFMEKKALNYHKRYKLMDNSSFLFFTFLPGSIKKSSSIKNSFAFEGVWNNNLNRKDLEKLKQQAEEEFTEFMAIFSSVEQIHLERLDEDELDLIKYQYLNLDFKQKEPLLYNEIDNTDKSHLAVGNKVVNVVSLRGQGELIDYSNKKTYTEQGKIAKSFIYPVTHDLRIPHITITTIQILIKEQAIKAFDRETEMLDGLMRMIPRFQKLAPRNNELIEFLTEIRSRDVAMVNFGMQVIAYSNSLEEQQQNLDLLKAAFNKMNKATYIQESFDNASLFFGGLPGNGNEIFRNILMPMDVATAHFNFTKEFKGDKQGTIYSNRHGSLIRFDYNHSEVDKQNEITIGPTRSGKSFDIGHRILDAFEKKEITIIIDKGGTYRNLIHNLGGKYFENTESNPIKINPLLIERDKNGEFILSKDSMVYLKTFFSIIWKNKDRGEIATNAEDSGLMWVIKNYYGGVNEQIKKGESIIPKMKHFFKWYENFIQENKETKDFVEFSQDFSFVNFLNVLKPFYDGIYAENFDVEENKLLTDEILICFDLGDLDKDPFMFRIMSTVIINLILNYIKLFPDIRKWIPIDEAWSLFSGDMGEFISYMFRTILKAKGKSTVITQGVEDLEKCEIGHVLISNAGVLSILNHAGQDYKKLQDILSLSDHELDLIKSLRKMKGREKFVRHQELRSQVLLLEAHPHEYAALTSQPDERNHLTALIKKYGNIHRAIEEWVKDWEAGAIIKESKTA